MDGKRITVWIPCQNVDSDGTPVNKEGIAYGRGWRSMITIEKKRVFASRFCPRDVRAGCRTAKTDGREIEKCACHLRWRLVTSGYEVSGVAGEKG